MGLQKPIKKAVIAAAGLGTRFLPQTKAIPKEMLPLVDKPIIQHIVEELVGAGIEQIIIVTGTNKRAIEDHFDDINDELMNSLQSSGKNEILSNVNKISKLAEFIYVRQKGTYGNATPLLNCETIIGDEPFIYTFADDFVFASPSRFKQLITSHEERGGSILTCVRSHEPADYARYGFVGGVNLGGGLVAVDTIIEKPKSATLAPSNLASVSGYIFEPLLFSYLHQQEKLLQPNEEFSMQPAIQQMINDGHKVYAKEIINGTFYDTGNKLEYIKAVIDFALQHDEIGVAFEAYLSKKPWLKNKTKAQMVIHK